MELLERKAFIERYSSRLANGCRIYNGTSGTGTKRGRAYLTVRNKPLTHYRIIWEALFGAPPADKYLLHSCGNMDCNNPEHLYLGTQVENAKDAQRHGMLPKSKTGITGVSFQTARQRYMVIDYTANKALYHGKDFFEACCRRKSWETHHA